MNVLAIGSSAGLIRSPEAKRVEYRLVPIPAPTLAPGQEEGHTVEIEVRYEP